MAENEIDRESLGSRPAIFVVGCPNVGKRTLLSRLLSVDIEDASDSSSGLLAQGWTINTKYYTAEVSLYMAHLHDGFDIESLPNHEKIAALVMVFDSSDTSTLVALKEWVTRTNIQNFDILLCVGNKVDLVPHHRAHGEYKRRLQEESQSLLRSDTEENNNNNNNNTNNNNNNHSLSSGTEDDNHHDESPRHWEVKKGFLEWFTERNIEFIEACGSNVEFDKCLCVDGDSQGIERVYGALSAHMWPGMVLKSGDKIGHPCLPERQDELSSEEEDDDYEQEYEILSAGGGDPWDGMEYDDGWVSASSSSVVVQDTNEKTNNTTMESSSSSSRCEVGESSGKLEPPPRPSSSTTVDNKDGGVHFELEDLEQVMCEIGNMRDNLRLLPDFQRREMAASLAMKMASMFGDMSECEDEEEEEVEESGGGGTTTTTRV